MAQALIALGGNVGNVRDTFRIAIKAICDDANATLVARSSDYATPPWGETNQPTFVNACIAIDTGLSPRALLDALHRIEAHFGRNRTREQHWGPRRLDLDLIAYDDLAWNEGALILPHPRWRERAFVVVPLAEIAPERAIGGHKPREVLATLSREGIERLPDDTP